MDIEKLSARIKAVSNSANIKIAGIAEFKGMFVQGINVSPQILNRMKKSTIITSTGASTRIEGSMMTDKEVEKLLNNIQVQKLKDRDSQEVAGYAELMKIIFDSYEDIVFSENTILNLHNILLKYSEKDSHHKGRFKTSSNKVVARDGDGNESVVFNPTKPYLTPIEMKDLIEWTIINIDGKEFHPLLVIANFVLEFLSIHPFKDGNGRLSRALTNLLLLQKGYKYVMYESHEKLIENSKVQYYLALRKSQERIKAKDNDIAPWVEYFFGILYKQAENVKKIMDSKPAENMLSSNQEKTLKLFDKFEEITTMIVVKELKIARPTVKQILSRLVELKFIEKSGENRGTKYRKINKMEK